MAQIINSFNFLDFSYCPISEDCIELYFFEGDPYQDFIRLALPAGVVSVELRTSNGQLFYALQATEFSYLNNVLTIDIETLPSPAQEYQNLKFSVLLDGSEVIASQKFVLTNDSKFIELSTRLIRFAFNEFENDYIQLRIPIVVKDAIPTNEPASKFITSEFFQIQVTQDTQEAYDLFFSFLRYTTFGRKLFNSLMQAFWTVKLEEGFFRRLASFEEYGLEYQSKENALNFGSHPVLASKLVFNDSQIGGEELDLDLFIEKARPFVFFISNGVQIIENIGTGLNESTHRIQLDLPVVEPQNVAWQVVPIGINPAIAQDFDGSMVFPSGVATIGTPVASGSVASFTISKLNTIIEAGVNYEVVLSDTDLIRFNTTNTLFEKGGLAILYQTTLLATPSDYLFGTILNIDTKQSNEEKSRQLFNNFAYFYTNEVDINAFAQGVQLLLNNQFNIAALANWSSSGAGQAWSSAMFISQNVARCNLPALGESQELSQTINLVIGKTYTVFVWATIQDVLLPIINDVVLRVIRGNAPAVDFEDFDFLNFDFPQAYTATFTATAVLNTIGVKIPTGYSDFGTIFIHSISIAENNGDSLFSSLILKNFLLNKITDRNTALNTASNMDTETINTLTITKEIAGYSYSITWSTSFVIGNENDKVYLILNNTTNGLQDGFDIGIRSDGSKVGASTFELGVVGNSINAVIGFYDNSVRKSFMSSQSVVFNTNIVP